MELELGLKLTNVVDDFAAAELLIAKDRGGPLFLCTQTESMFFMTAHLKGYRKKNIKIDINDDGSRITISGEKPVQEMVMVGWQVVKKEVQMRGFRKVFKIPSGVILDKIKARFIEDESELTISMPKLVKGVTGVGIEELKEEEMPRGETESLQLVADEDVSEGEKLKQEECAKSKGVQVQESDQTVQDVPKQTPQKLIREEVHELAPTKAEIVGSTGSDPKKLEEEDGHEFSETSKERKKIGTVEETRGQPDHVAQPKELPGIAPGLEKELQEKGTQTDQEITRDIQEQEKPQNDQVEPTCSLKQSSDESRTVHEQEVGRTEKSIPEEKEADDEPYAGEKENELHDQSTDKGHRRKSKKICTQGIIVGSSLLVSLVVLVIHLIRSNNQTTKKRN